MYYALTAHGALSLVSCGERRDGTQPILARAVSVCSGSSLYMRILTMSKIRKVVLLECIYKVRQI